eukprot:5887428-Prymnesium_polylepis.3
MPVGTIAPWPFLLTVVVSLALTPRSQHTMLLMYVDANASETQLLETFPAKYGWWDLDADKYREGIDIQAECTKSSVRKAGKSRRAP